MPTVPPHVVEQLALRGRLRATINFSHPVLAHPA